MLTPDQRPSDQDSGTFDAEVPWAPKILPVLTQFLGLGILLAAVWYAFQCIENINHLTNTPGGSVPAIESLVKTLKLDENIVPEKPGNDIQVMTIHFSRVLALILLFAGNALTGMLCIALASAGGRMALGGLLEKREFLKAMRDFLGAMRAESERRQ